MFQNLALEPVERETQTVYDDVDSDLAMGRWLWGCPAAEALMRQIEAARN